MKTIIKIFSLQIFGFLGLTTTSYSSFGQIPYNPTGTYSFKEKTKKRMEPSGGYKGIILVKKLNDKRIVMTFYINKGAPTYNSGTFSDTLEFADNIVTHINNDCVTTFYFTKRKITVTEKSNGSCWQPGVYAHGVYRKKIKKRTILTYLCFPVVGVATNHHANCPIIFC